MIENSNAQKIQELDNRLKDLVTRQHLYIKEINALRLELNELMAQQSNVVPEKSVSFDASSPIDMSEAVENKQIFKPIPKEKIITEKRSKTDWESFIGENLLSKIGIAVLIIGIAFLAGYAIEHDLISPLMRIVLAYAVAGILGFFAFRFYTKYQNFSAVLLSGASAITFSVTYAAFVFYGFYGKFPTFLLMFLIMAATVVSSLKYNKVYIAQFGLIAAYSIPFLLSDGTGHISLLFIYMFILNLGILILAMYRKWESLFLSSFVATCLIFLACVITQRFANEFLLLLTTAVVFHILFHIIHLLYLHKHENRKEYVQWIFIIQSIIPLIVLAQISIFNRASEATVFSLVFAAVFLASYIYLFKAKQIVTSRILFISFIVFLNLAFFIHFRLPIVSIFLSIQALGIVFYSRWSRDAQFLRSLSAITIYLAAGSLLMAWLQQSYDELLTREKLIIKPFLNAHFGAVLVLCGGLLSSQFLLARSERKIIVPSIVGAIFFVLGTLIEFSRVAFDVLKYQINEFTFLETSPSYQAANYCFIFIFLGAVFILNKNRWQEKAIAITAFCASILFISIFLFFGLLQFSEAREIYQKTGIGNNFLLFRYLIFAALSFLIFAIYKQLKTKAISGFRIFSKSAIHVILLWILTSELIQYLDLAGAQNTYKLGISVLWALYAFVMVAIGIYQKNQFLRISAFVLFGITLIKLFAYDMAQMNTISKIIVFVILGILLLVISFLYNKFKSAIFDTEKQKTDVN